LEHKEVCWEGLGRFWFFGNDSTVKRAKRRLFSSENLVEAGRTDGVAAGRENFRGVSSTIEPTAAN